jgi:hypothetical protein
MSTSISDILRDAGASSIFWIGLGLILVIALIGYLVTRRASVDPSPVGEEVKVLHDWTPTGRIDFGGPSMDASAADTPALFYLQAEDIRLLISFSGIERKEIRWRKATLNEAKRVVNIFHRKMTKETERIPEDTTSPTTPSDGEGSGIVATGAS